MLKVEKGSIKDLANKMKAKGLQKLRWYCQMCQKQCRDENGYKCHITSESHQRQLLLYADNPHKYLDEFSKEFSDGYIELLRRRFGTKRVHANIVYKEYISDRNHLHMNATKWLTLTEFVKWLSREGICTVDENEKGWFVTWIDRDPETIARQKELAKKAKMDKDDEERMSEFIEAQIIRAKEKLGDKAEAQFTELRRDNEEEKLVLNISSKTPKPSVAISSSSSYVFKSAKRSFPSDVSTISRISFRSGSSKMSALEEMRAKEKYRNSGGWLKKGIVVKVITRELGDKFYLKKGVVKKILGKHTGIVQLIESKMSAMFDEGDLQSVIPGIGEFYPGEIVQYDQGEKFERTEILAKTFEEKIKGQSSRVNDLLERVRSTEKCSHQENIEKLSKSSYRKDQDVNNFDVIKEGKSLPEKIAHLKNEDFTNINLMKWKGESLTETILQQYKSKSSSNLAESVTNETITHFHPSIRMKITKYDQNVPRLTSSTNGIKWCAAVPQEPKRPSFQLKVFEPCAHKDVSPESSDEDLDDEIVRARHERWENVEKRKYLSNFNREQENQLERLDEIDWTDWDKQFTKTFDKISSWKSSHSLNPCEQNAKVGRGWKLKPRAAGENKEDWQPGCFIQFTPRAFPISEAEYELMKPEDDENTVSKAKGA